MPVDEGSNAALAAAEPHPGCNCGRRRVAAAAPLLTPDLVIAARDRAREPELAEATVAHALATPVPIRLAQYDVVIVAGSLGSPEREARLAAEFARHEHRVFHLREGHEKGPTAPTLRRVSIPLATLEDSQALAAALRDLRREEAIEAATLFAPPILEPLPARELRERWSWRVATVADDAATAPEAFDLRLRFETETPRTGELALPRGMPWPARWAEIDKALRSLWPRASIVVLTHDNLVFNRLCIGSVFANTEYPNYELIVIDNASQDGTVEELRRLESAVPRVRVLLNDHNAGFGPGNNQGLATATGEILVLLNNDTIVPRGWLTRLARHLGDPRVGLIGPGTNRTCNEAQIDIPYQTYAEYQAVARRQSERHEGQRVPIRMPMMFCAAFRRDAYEHIGPLDERFEVGMFEDEDYALRAKGLGYEVAWTPEVYVHHAYHASIGKLLPTGEYMRLVRLNQGRFEEKWGICWERHRPPPAPAT